jgi:hypothetical protein
VLVLSLPGSERRATMARAWAPANFTWVDAMTPDTVPPEIVRLWFDGFVAVGRAPPGVPVKPSWMTAAPQTDCKLYLSKHVDLTQSPTRSPGGMEPPFPDPPTRQNPAPARRLHLALPPPRRGARRLPGRQDRDRRVPPAPRAPDRVRGGAHPGAGGRR